MKKTVLVFLAIAACLPFLTFSRVDAEEINGGSYFETIFPAPEKEAFGVLPMAAEWRIWIPNDVETLRGVVVHQHGCGAGSGDGARTAVYDWHWQELARQNDCALIAASYRQGDAPCEAWCDPRNGSGQSLLDALDYFSEASGRPELKVVPWALWGHSGGGHWVGSMVQLYPKRVAGAWLRSGCPDTVGQIYDELPMNDDVLNVPIVLNIGAHEHNFPMVWVSCWQYFGKIREKGAKIGLLVDPRTQHETGDSRYPAIRFLDICLKARLPEKAGSAELKPAPEGLVLPIEQITDAEISAENVVKDAEQPDANYDAAERREFLKRGLWFPYAEFVDVWRKYSIDCSFDDATPPPAPTAVVVDASGLLTWNCRADLESGLKTFVIYRDDEVIAELPTAPSVSARPVFQGVMYSDTPDYSLPRPEYKIEKYDAGVGGVYSVAAVNSCGLISERTSAK